MRAFFSFLVVTGLLLACLGACSSCLRHNPGKPKLPLSEVQRARTVAITTFCNANGTARRWGGTGTIIAPYKVLTAAHVTKCDGPSVIVFELLSGQIYIGTVDKSLDAFDISTIKTDKRLPSNKVTVADRPVYGDVICYEGATPRRSRKCGRVHLIELEPSDVDIGHDADTIGGNSGAGVYNTRGALIGVVTKRNRDGTKGWVASLWAHRDALGL